MKTLPALLLLLPMLTACGDSLAIRASTRTTDRAAGDRRPHRLPESPIFTALQVPGHPDAVVSIPSGAGGPRPVVVVLHGSGDRPDWNCDCWRHVTSAHPWVLCPRGAFNAEWSSKDDQRFTHRGSVVDIEKHIDDALEALRARWPDHVDVRRPLLAGFSLGASQAAMLAAARPQRFDRVALVEGQRAWETARPRARRVLVACGWRACEQAAPHDDALHATSANVGHSYDRALQERIQAELPWWIGDDDRWPSLSAPSSR